MREWKFIEGTLEKKNKTVYWYEDGREREKETDKKRKRKHI